VSLAWLLADPLISSPIIGATSVEQLDENLGALDVKLAGEEKRKIDELTAWA
jgi:aryl-alcohol dehydrogenase-like predicted oxidoreductase